MMATKTKQRPKTSVITDTGGMITTDLNEYLMRRSHVNYKDRFYPKEETDLMTTSAKKMQNLVAIEKKYIDNLETGKKEDIGRSYFFDDPNYDNLLGYSTGNLNGNLTIFSLFTNAQAIASASFVSSDIPIKLISYPIKPLLIFL